MHSTRKDFRNDFLGFYRTYEVRSWLFRMLLMWAYKYVTKFKDVRGAFVDLMFFNFLESLLVCLLCIIIYKAVTYTSSVDKVDGVGGIEDCLLEVDSDCWMLA